MAVVTVVRTRLPPQENRRAVGIVMCTRLPQAPATMQPRVAGNGAKGPSKEAWCVVRATLYVGVVVVWPSYTWARSWCVQHYRRRRSRSSRALACTWQWTRAYGVRRTRAHMHAHTHGEKERCWGRGGEREREKERAREWSWRRRQKEYIVRTVFTALPCPLS